MNDFKGLNIDKVSLKILLGGDIAYRNVVLKIFMIVIRYVLSTKRISEL